MSDSSNSPRQCVRCGAALHDAPEGLCPRCLMAEAMQATQAGEPVARIPVLSPAELAPHFPHLEILECLGRGGMGVVYKARQKSLHRLVALKLLAPERADDPEFAARFAREARALAALNHPHIVGVHDFGEAGGFFYLLMEYVDGVNLRQLLQSRKLSPREALRIVPPICEALQCAHDRGIVHRDIKPENLLIDKSGNVKIADFGIAKMVGAASADMTADASGGTTNADTMTAGTPDYAAPEQHDSTRTTDHRADIYSLGVVFYEMLTGERPADAIVPPSRRVQVDVRIDEIVLRALERVPELRFQTAQELRAQVETVAAGPAGPPEPRVLRASGGMLATPDDIRGFHGQFTHFMHGRGHLVLDDRNITFTRGGAATVIPLASIRDLSVGQYPRAMNPSGLKLISITYEEDGAAKQVLIAPIEGMFGLRSVWNDRTLDWWAEMLRATERLTGKVPAQTPPEKLGIPRSSPLVLGIILVPVLVGILYCFLSERNGGRSIVQPAFLVPLALGAAFLAMMLLGRKGRRSKGAMSGGAVGHASAETVIAQGAALERPGSSETTLAWMAMGSAALSGLLGIYVWVGSRGSSAAYRYPILACALLGLLLGKRVRRHPLGIAAAVVGGVNVTLWLIIALLDRSNASPFVPPPAPPAKTVAVRKAPPDAVLAAELKLARNQAEQAEAAYQAGRVGGMEAQAARDKVAILEAELTGDPVRVAEARLAAAEARLEFVTLLHASGRISNAEKMTAEGEVEIARANLEAEKAGQPVKP